MNCPRCQHENEAGAKFCEECAAPLARACTQCGRPLSPTAKFCPECAHPTGLPAAPPPAQRFDSPESYTPKHLAEKILTSKSALEGERKLVTVLFADLKGSMELLADRDPEEARKILDPVLKRMMEAVHRYEGTVNQVMGDGIMALFGAPLAHEDHAVRAGYAALRMQESVKRYAEDVHRTEGVPIQIRVGLNSGEVVVRSIGSDLRMDYTAVGQTTHLAARMEQLAIPGSILITAETLGLVEGYVLVKTLGPRPIRGLPAPVEVYEVVGAATVRSRFQAATTRGLTRFVGRETELDQLQQALEQARAGRGQVVAVVGEPGIGKSRLYWEFTHSHRTHGWLILEAGSVSYGKATNYLPLVELLRAYFQIEAVDGARKITEKITGKLLSLDRSLDAVIPPLLWLLDVPVDDDAWARVEAAQRRRQTLDGVKRLLLRESQAQPLIVVFEDLHWIDAETQVLLDSLIESLPTARLLLLVNYRPEYQHAWSGKTYYRLLRIDPLAQATSEEFLEALLGTDVSLRPLKDVLIARTEGNPFFLEESVRTLVETKILAGERGVHRLTKMPDEYDRTLQIPATARALLAARIDRLSPEDKRLLQAASVIGPDVPFDLLQAIVDENETDQRLGLTRLQAAEFLYETRLFPELEYTFKHALTHEVTYGSLLHERRRALHGRIVEAIEQRYPDRLTEQAERLAHHALRGERWEAAVSYLGQAGTKAEGRAANREAVEYFEQALMALQHLPESRDTLAQAVDLRFDLRRPLFQLGESTRILACLREAGTLADRLGDPVRGGWARAQLGGHAWISGDHGPGLELAHQAHRTAVESGDVELRVHAALRVGWAYHALGDYSGAAEFLRDCLANLPAERERERFGHVGLPAAMARSFLAWSLAEQGAFAEGRTYGLEAMRLADIVDHRFSRIFCPIGLGMIYLLSGEARRAIEVLAPAHELAETVSPTTASLFVTPALGLAYARTGAVDRALPLLQASLESTAAHDFLLYHPMRLAALGEAHLVAGRTEEAMDHTRRAADMARTRGERGHEAHALRLLGEVSERHATPEVADQHFRAALRLATDLGMRPLIAHCHLGLGKLYRRTGDGAKVQEHLATAATMYREMGMSFWLEKAAAALGPPHTNSP